MTLGIDPGTAILGYGLVESDGEQLCLAECGVLRTGPEEPLAQRLASLYAGLTSLIERYRPDDVAVEELFFNRNVQSALAVGQARGVALLAAAHHGLSVTGYTPLQVKHALTGYGRARKTQIQEMVRVLLSLEHAPEPDDAADAVALAICHLHTTANETYYRTMEQSSTRIQA